MNLAAFVGKKVLVQFRGPWLLVAESRAGLPTLALQTDKDGKAIPMQIPFALGTLVELTPGGAVVFEYRDDASQPASIMRTMFHEDVIFSVSEVAERRLVTL
jgi:hypothetical protein